MDLCQQLKHLGQYVAVTSAGARVAGRRSGRSARATSAPRLGGRPVLRREVDGVVVLHGLLLPISAESTIAADSGTRTPRPRPDGPGALAAVIHRQSRVPPDAGTGVMASPPWVVFVSVDFASTGDCVTVYIAGNNARFFIPVGIRVIKGMAASAF